MWDPEAIAARDLPGRRVVKERVFIGAGMQRPRETVGPGRPHPDELKESGGPIRHSAYVEITIRYPFPTAQRAPCPVMMSTNECSDDSLISTSTWLADRTASGSIRSPVRGTAPLLRRVESCVFLHMSQHLSPNWGRRQPHSNLRATGLRHHGSGVHPTTPSPRHRSHRLRLRSHSEIGALHVQRLAHERPLAGLVPSLQGRTGRVAGTRSIA